MYRSFRGKTPLISNALSVVGFHTVAVGCGAGGTAGVVTGSLTTLICCPTRDIRRFSPQRGGETVQVHPVHQCWPKASPVWHFLPCDSEQGWLQPTGAGSGHCSCPAVVWLGWNLDWFSSTLLYCWEEERGSMRSSVWYTAESSTVLLAVLEDIQRS